MNVNVCKNCELIEHIRKYIDYEYLPGIFRQNTPTLELISQTCDQVLANIEESCKGCSLTSVIEVTLSFKINVYIGKECTSSETHMMNRQYQISKILLEKGFFTDDYINFNSTPLATLILYIPAFEGHWESAVFKHAIKMIQLFIEHGADPNWESKSGWTALCEIFMFQKYTIIPLLKTLGFNINHINKNGESVLEYVIRTKIKNSCLSCPSIEKRIVFLHYTRTHISVFIKYSEPTREIYFRTKKLVKSLAKDLNINCHCFKKSAGGGKLKERFKEKCSKLSEEQKEALRYCWKNNKYFSIISKDAFNKIIFWTETFH